MTSLRFCRAQAWTAFRDCRQSRVGSHIMQTRRAKVRICARPTYSVQRLLTRLSIFGHVLVEFQCHSHKKGKTYMRFSLVPFRHAREMRRPYKIVIMCT